MTGTERRRKILELIEKTGTPLSGGALGKLTGVSRQVVVQDVALLRTEGHHIVATARGYLMNKSDEVSRIFKVCHTADQIDEELTTIVDLGACVENVTVNHRAYGRMSATLKIASRRDVQLFMEQMRSGKSTPLMNVTSGYHFHKITAKSEEILDDVEQALREKNFLAEVMPYEQEELN